MDSSNLVLPSPDRDQLRTVDLHERLINSIIDMHVCVLSHSDSLQRYELYTARLLCPWDFPGKNTGVSCHFLLQEDLPDPGIKPVSLASPALAGRFFTTCATWEARFHYSGINAQQCNG